MFFADEDPTTTDDRTDGNEDDEVTRFVPLTLADGEHVLKVCGRSRSLCTQSCVDEACFATANDVSTGGRESTGA